MARLLVGTSGWVYPHWKGTFYPDELNEREWFSYYSRRFDTVEINNSFYRLPSRQAFEKWRLMAPAGFTFTVKASRYITHVKKLREPAESVGRLYANLSGLKDRCAAVLFQLPPNWGLNIQRLREFLGVLPNSTRAVLELRNESWLTDEVYALLRDHGVALCFADMPFYPGPRVRTADFSFFRRHGGRGARKPLYTKGEIRKLAGEVERELTDGRDCFVYFNNDFGGYAIRNALELKSMVQEKGVDTGAGNAGR
jgi:uncharacterized protein YecE (DUF72 family)